MKNEIRYYAIKDIVVGSFMNVYPLHNDEEAKRAVRESVRSNNGVNDLTARATDLQFWYLFTLNIDTGLIVDNEPHIIANVYDFVKNDVKEN